MSDFLFSYLLFWLCHVRHFHISVHRSITCRHLLNPAGLGVVMALVALRSGLRSHPADPEGVWSRLRTISPVPVPSCSLVCSLSGPDFLPRSDSDPDSVAVCLPESATGSGSGYESLSAVVSVSEYRFAPVSDSEYHSV